MNQQLQNSFQALKDSGSKKLAVLLDPDKVKLASLPTFIDQCVNNQVGYFFVGGSLISRNQTAAIIKIIRECSDIPVIIFPGSNLHIEPSADAILLLSLISGRNPEFLIGQHVVAAPLLKQSGLEILSTGYILIDSGRQTTVSYISNTTPIPADKPEIAACTAMAGEMLGMKLIYLDGGSGALYPVSAKMIEMVKNNIDTPLIVGGGINSAEKAHAALQAGADVIVIGNAFEKKPELLTEIAQVAQQYSTVIH
jgi:phosphoglycerol geranylgeranyltransferase